jgi:receptor protein-tyrosine kinase
VNTIEQAAKRLEQLRRAGIGETQAADPDAGTAAAAPSPKKIPSPILAVQALERAAGLPVDQPVRPARDPQRVSPETEQRIRVHAEAPVAPARDPQRVSPETEQRPRTQPYVEIDLARLSAMGYVTPHAPRSRLADEFRVIKRPLLMNAHGKSASPIERANRIMITSSMAGEGKTFVSINLAMSLAMELDTTVLLVDADAARPAVLDRLGLKPAKGLLDVLTEPDLKLADVLLKTNVERLTILPAGTQQERATELLASAAMNTLVEELASRYPDRIVVFDAPPLIASTESRVLAAHMGQVILIVEADKTPQSSVAEALATVENCPVVMTLLNKAHSSEVGYGYYGY